MPLIQIILSARQNEYGIDSMWINWLFPHRVTYNFIKSNELFLKHILRINPVNQVFLFFRLESNFIFLPPCNFTLHFVKILCVAKNLPPQIKQLIIETICGSWLNCFFFLLFLRNLVFFDVDIFLLKSKILKIIWDIVYLNIFCCICL